MKSGTQLFHAHYDLERNLRKVGNKVTIFLEGFGDIMESASLIRVLRKVNMKDETWKYI